MILDKMENRSLYEGCHRSFALAFEVLRGAVEDQLPVGKYELGDFNKGVSFTVSVQEYRTHLREEGKFEGHQEYIDIQYIVSGREEIDVCDRSRAEAITEYNGEKDVCFFTSCERATCLTLKAGDYAIFFPGDIHKPGLSPDGEKTAVKKIVLKVKV